MLIIGFALGQIQLVEPMLKEYNKLFNEEVRRYVLIGRQVGSFSLTV